MLICDSPYQKRERYRNVVEKTRELTATGLAHQSEQVARNNPVDGFDPTVEEHQMGRPLFWKEFISRILKMNSNLMFEDSPSAPETTTALLYPELLKTETGGTELKKHFLCAFDKCVLPEYTVLKPVYEWAWDTEKRDFVKVLKTTKFVRGWREVLVKLLSAKLIRNADVEVLFPLTRIRKSWHDLTQPREQRGGLIQLVPR